MEESIYTRSYEHEQAHWWFVARREILTAVVATHLAEGRSLVDIGCGSGFFLDAVRSRYDAWGADPSPIAVSACRSRGLSQVFAASAYDLVTAAGRLFDAACFFDVLEHLDDDAGALRAAREALTPGGRVFVTVPAFMFLWSSRDVAHHHRRRYVRTQLGALLESTGFTVERLTYFNSYLFPLAAAFRLAGKATGRDTSRDISLPPAFVNRTFRKIFAAERHRIAPARGGNFPIGVSLLAVGRRSP